MELVVWLSSALALAGLAFAFWSHLTKQKTSARNSELEAKLVQIESRFLDLQKQREEGVQKELKREKKGRESEHQEELLGLRKESAQQKAELKKLQGEIKHREQEIKDIRAQTENEMEKIRMDKESLLAQLREFESHLRVAQEANRKLGMSPEQVISLKKDHDAMKSDLDITRGKLVDEEKKLRSEQMRLRERDEKLSELQREVRRYREATTLNGGQPIDARDYVRWRERAQEGRRMYQLMKGLRELSDKKLVSYQENIEKISTYLLIKAGRKLPEVRSSELRAERYLGEALGLIADENPEKLDDFPDKMESVETENPALVPS